MLCPQPVLPFRSPHFFIFLFLSPKASQGGEFPAGGGRGGLDLLQQGTAAPQPCSAALPGGRHSAREPSFPFIAWL